MSNLKDIGRLVLAVGLGIATALAPLATYAQEDSQPKKKKPRKIELDKIYQRWVNEDVDYIITPEERAAFKKLQTDEEREEFIEQFWLRRDPDPDTPENEYREEYYRRIAYANEKFTSGIPGWKTDRGRIYITWGPPDSVESRPAGALRAPDLRRRRNDLDLPVRDLVLPVSGRRRFGHRDRVRGPDGKRRIPHCPQRR